MLSFAVKVTFFVIAVVGLLSCWAVLYAFASIIGSWWGPISYSIGVTLLIGIFGLGIIWRLDPFLMPRWFCVTQAIGLSFASFVITGTCAAFALATTISVLRPSHRVQSTYSTLMWRKEYLYLILVYPLLASTVQISVLMKLDAAQPTDNMYCDASHPEWVRLLGYAGMPFVVALPSFCLSTAAAYRIIKMHLASLRFQRRYTDSAPITHSAGFNKLSFLSRPGGEITTRHLSLTPAIAQDSMFPEEPTDMSPPNTARALLNPDVQRSDLSIPLDSLPSDALKENVPSSENISVMERQRRSSATSMSFPTFAPLSSPPSLKDEEEPSFSMFPDSRQTLHNKDRDKGFQEEGAGAVYADEREDEQYMENRLSQELRASVPSLAPAIWRLVLFQLAFFFILVLCALSTIIDIAQHRATPSAFGSQHVALLFAAWGPAVVFGHLPGVRRRLMFWK